MAAAAVDWQHTDFWRSVIRGGAVRRHRRGRRQTSLLAELQDVSNRALRASTNNLAKELEKLWIALRVPLAERKRQERMLHPLSSRTYIQIKAQIARLTDIRCRLLDILETLARRENLFATVCSELQDASTQQSGLVNSKETIVHLAELRELGKVLESQLDEWDLVVPWASPFVWSGVVYREKLRNDAEILARLATRYGA